MEFVMGIIPDNAVAALANGELLPILYFTVLFGLATAALGTKAAPVITLFERVTDIFFGIWKTLQHRVALKSKSVLKRS